MARAKTNRAALSVDQLARRWGLGSERVRRLVEMGLLPGSFKVPSAGRYGEAIRIPLSTVLQAEEDWAIHRKTGDSGKPLRRRAKRTSPVVLEHFPELSPEHDAVCHEGDQH